MTVHVSIDRELCIGSGNCVYLSNGAIELDAYNVAEVRDTSEATVVQLQMAQRSARRRRSQSTNPNW